MAIQQISIFIEDRQGQMADVIKKIADAGINIRALSVADSRDFGILRLIVSDTAKTKELLEEDVLVKVTDVIAVRMDDIHGALYKILKVLEDAQINLDYSYAFTASKDKGAYVVFRVADNEAAEKLLSEKGFTFIDEV
ncbi:MAG: ACT domain-containing protein [Lachnospiraceae bacterium]|nr:ACT domain-containing protein [Lachnospiraceae bacterium]